MKTLQSHKQPSVSSRLPLRNMKLKVSSQLDCSPEAAWEEVKKISLLLHIIHPVAKLKPVKPAVFPTYWPAGEDIELKTFLWGVIPMGIRTLSFENIDDAKRQLQTRERDPLINRWDHLITIEKGQDGKTFYTDSLVIDAGLLTLPVWLFANFFYRHRQSRWRKLAPKLGKTNDR